MRRRRAIVIAGAVLVALVVLAPEAAVAQCAMCRTALESPESRALASGFRRAVLFLLAAPFTAIGAIAFLVHRRVRASEETPEGTAGPALD
jgi:hypothetical protein